ncbi:hypothetical protein COOONC_05934 [Cooperia oncophora]
MDIFKTQLEPFNTAVIFGAENLMTDMVPKLSEMRSGTSLLACRFPLPECDHFQPVAQIGEGIDAVYVYRRTYGMRTLLSVVTRSLVFQRDRATYYQNKKGILPVFVRRFFLRHPHAHLWIVLGLLISSMVGPSLIPTYYFFTLSPEEFRNYQLERKNLVHDRAKYGRSAVTALIGRTVKNCCKIY